MNKKIRWATSRVSDVYFTRCNFVLTFAYLFLFFATYTVVSSWCFLSCFSEPFRDFLEPYELIMLAATPRIFMRRCGEILFVAGAVLIPLFLLRSIVVLMKKGRRSKERLYLMVVSFVQNIFQLLFMYALVWYSHYWEAGFLDALRIYLLGK